MKVKITLSDKEYLQIKDLIYKESGIDVPIDQKENLEFKLYSRLMLHNLSSFREYYELLLVNQAEKQAMINAVTTNETYFFRELRHFNFLKREILPDVKYELFRCWSAAGSNGAEAYSIAMDITENLSNYKNFEVVMSDINDNVLKVAQKAIYPLKFAKKIPPEYLKKYCLKGKNRFAGSFKISKEITDKVKIRHINLVEPIIEPIGQFDVIFLRNIIIYFNDNEKKKIVENVIKHLKDGGYLFMGHSESLSRITDKVFQVIPSVYKKGSKNIVLTKMPKTTFKKVTDRVVAIGSSMGGLSVLEDILSKLEQNSPPILIVQHMSRDILPSVIEKLSSKCKVRLKEAEDQETIEQGCVYFAPYNKHLKIKKISKGVYKTLLDDAEKIANHKPSIDVLFKSFAVEVKRDAHAFILTGMGVDGVDGMKDLKASGAKTYAQDEQSSEIFGMAKVAIEAGYIDKVIASSEIPKYIL